MICHEHRFLLRMAAYQNTADIGGRGRPEVRSTRSLRRDLLGRLSRIDSVGLAAPATASAVCSLTTIAGGTLSDPLSRPDRGLRLTATLPATGHTGVLSAEAVDERMRVGTTQCLKGHDASMVSALGH
jgi:hypothetical protein